MCEKNFLLRVRRGVSIRQTPTNNCWSTENRPPPNTINSAMTLDPVWPADHDLDAYEALYIAARAWLREHIVQCIAHLEPPLLDDRIDLNELMTTCALRAAAICNLNVVGPRDVEFIRLVTTFHRVRHLVSIRRILFRAVVEELRPEMLNGN
jgi:hypothetical protein